MTEVTRAIILAAGRGVRMGERGKLIPKGLIEVGGKPLIVRSLDILFNTGIEHVTMVTGHLAEAFQPLKQRYGSRLGQRYNQDYATKGSLESLRLGLNEVPGPCLLLESDIIYEPRTIETALHSTHESVIVISGPTGSTDEVYVWTAGQSDELVFDTMSKLKSLKDREPSGELVGVHKIGQDLHREILAAASTLSGTDDYENAINLARQHTPVHCELVSDLVWAEIDNEAMYDRVNRLIEPRLREIAKQA